jgi:Holliday junction DNA helicase RuvA
MIGRLRGLLVEKRPTRVVLECQGIGFELGVPLSTSRILGDEGREATLFVETYFTRDGVQLFGFGTRAERETFCQLTSVKGVGPRAGLNLLSRLEPAEIRAAIAAGRMEVMLTVPGIGPKKAESIIKKLQEAVPAEREESGVLADAAAALVSLGLSRREARERLGRVPATGAITLQEILKQALAQRG